MTEIQLKAKRERDAKAKRDKRAAVKLAAKDAAVDPTEVLVLDAPQTQAEAEALVEQKAAPLVKVLPVKTDSDKNAKRLVGLSGFVAKKKASLKQKPVEAAATEAPKAARGKDPAAPLNIILYAAGFKFMGKEEVDGAIASGYTHADGRAALVTVKDGEAVWMTNPGETGYEAGSTAESLTTALIMRDTLLTQTVQSINKKLSGEGRLTGVKDKIAEQKDALAKAAPQPATLLKTLPDGTPAATARAVEMLGGLTLQRFDLASLKGDKHYGHRMALLRVLFDKERGGIKADETGIKHLTEAFHSAVGAKGGSAPAREADFATRCKAIAVASRKAKADAKKAEESALKQRKADVKATGALFVPGTILDPPSKPPSKEERRAAHDAAADEVFTLAINTEPIMMPRSDASVELIPGDVGLLEDPENGVMMMQLERENSQGAICVYNNGKRVAAGVVPPEILKKLRAVSGQVDLIEAAANLLNPPVPGVPVTPVAARHLTAVMHCKELAIMATKKAVSQKSKKFDAPAKAETRAAKPATSKATKEPKAPKAAKPKKEAGAPRKASTYRLVNASKKVWEAYTAQKGAIVAALVKAGAVGAKAAGITAAALTEATGVAAKNVAFYMSVWQNEAKTGAVVIEKLAAAE